MTFHPGAAVARDIGATILERADEQGWTLDEVADRADIRRTQLRRMVEGEDAINTDHMVKIAKVLGVTPADLLGSVGPATDILEATERDFEDLLRDVRDKGLEFRRVYPWQAA